MAEAPVGDDVYGDDPTVRELETLVAEFLGKESAVFMPTGSMTNQVAIRCHTEPGDRVLMDAGAHVVRSEGGGPAALSGVTAHRLGGVHGIFSPAQVEEALGIVHRFSPTTLRPPATLLCVENTHNGGGGSVWPLDQLDGVVEVARTGGLRTHLDGARLWNASVATGIPESRYAGPFDSVSVCFSKGLGAPVGSVLAGASTFAQRARRFKQLFGGGFRQAGMLAAGALFALRNHRSDLQDDHAKADRFARRIGAVEGIQVDPDLVETNIVRFGVEWGAGEFVEACFDSGVHMLPTGAHAVRAVMHRDVSMDDVEKAAEAIENVLATACYHGAT